MPTATSEGAMSRSERIRSRLSRPRGGRAAPGRDVLISLVAMAGSPALSPDYWQTPALVQAAASSVWVAAASWFVTKLTTAVVNSLAQPSLAAAP